MHPANQCDQQWWTAIHCCQSLDCSISSVHVSVWTVRPQQHPVISGPPICLISQLSSWSLS